MVLINHGSAPISKERLSATSKPRTEASRNKLVEKSGVPDSVESPGEVDRTKEHHRVRLGFVKLIRNILRQKQNLIESKSTMTDPPRRGENGVGLQKKKSTREKIRSKSFETQKLREIGQKEAAKSSGFIITKSLSDGRNIKTRKD